jgi:four helix bundle protein
MPYTPIEDTPVYLLACSVADELWDIILGWDAFAQRSLGGQLVRAADSVGANLVEGDGRGSDPDALRFFVFARASAREARHWVRTAARRDLLDAKQAEDIDLRLVEIAKSINGLIAYRRSSSNSPGHVRESVEPLRIDASEAIDW